MFICYQPRLLSYSLHLKLTNMSLNSYVTLGRSGLRVSPLWLGAMTFGEGWGAGSSPEESEAILARYRELGGNFLDTSNAYNNGHSEKIIGDSIGRESSKHDRMVISTKMANNLYPGDPNGGGCGTKSIIEQCEQSLRRLQKAKMTFLPMKLWYRLPGNMENRWPRSFCGG